MKIDAVAPGSASFRAVIKLWRTESAHLGFMPEGGFEDAARSGCLVAAEDDDGSVAGYSMFRRTALAVAVIVHLCVSPSYRRTGVARSLFEATKEACADCFEIRLRCRRDFPAAALWPRLGFVPVKDEPGRGREGTLTVWRYELRPLPLFHAARQEQLSIVKAAIDANIFFDLDDRLPGEDESRYLIADWLGEFVELQVTQEIFTEINRNNDSAERERQRERAMRFPQIPRNVAREERVLTRVRELLGCSDTPNALSDVRQVAMTVAADVPFFITRDQDVLEASDSLDEEFGLEVMSPHEFIRRFDELRREQDYRPSRLFFGPSATVAIARADDIEQMADLLHTGQPVGERRRRTLGRLRDMLAAPERYDVRCIRQDGTLVAAYVIDRSLPDRIQVPFFGVAPSQLGRTAARHYGDALVSTASREGRRIVVVEGAGPRVEEALGELGFSKEGDAWIKLTLPLALPAAGVAAEVERVGASGPPATELAQRLAAELRVIAGGPGLARTRALEVERALWPAKIRAVNLPCFLVPIQPRWAKELFDRDLAQLTLFGADPSLSLNSENVYYRAARPEIISAPSRVLWYVSDDRAYPESMAVRACSYIDEVVVDLPKELFRRFRRLGVYDWNSVYSIAKHDISTKIMAFRFSKTELFGSPVQWSVMQEVLKAYGGGRGSQLQSPIAISEECYFELYCRGVRPDAA
jgi:GNAT superfamily N-acetyltransferase